MPSECSTYSSFSDYAFLFNFTSSNGEGYIRVPLATFASNVKQSGGNTVCSLAITYLNTLNSQSSDIILGGLFFTEFFGVFTNNYNTDPVTQSTLLYVGNNAVYNAYAGNEALPTGVNPFQPVTPTPDDKNNSWIWIVVLSVLCVLLLGGLGFAIYKWRTAQAAAAQQRGIIYDEKKPLVNSSEEI